MFAEFSFTLGQVDDNDLVFQMMLGDDWSRKCCGDPFTVKRYEQKAALELIQFTGVNTSISKISSWNRW